MSDDHAHETPNSGSKPALPSTGRRGLLGSLREIPEGFLAIAGAEMGLLRRFPRFGLAVGAIALFPALYLVIYISGVWDPVSRTGDLPVAIVNLDRGIDYRGQALNVGDDLYRRLSARTDFTFVERPDEAETLRAVQAGELAFALVVPQDFSLQAVPGAAVGGGRIRIIISEGNNYSTAGIARRFASELGHAVNESLNETRWQAVLALAGKSAGSLDELRSGVGQLVDGARQLNEGTRTYGRAAREVADGFGKVSAAVRQIDGKMPAASDLAKLKSGARTLAAGQDQLTRGLSQLEGGAGKLRGGLLEMQEKSKSIPFGGSRVSDGAGQLAAGAQQLQSGARSARQGSARLAAGAGQVAGGTGKLVDGVSALSAGVDELASKLPAQDRLDAFAAGSDQLTDGSDRLLAGLERLDAALPASIENLDGSAAGLAASVEPEIENLSPVPNNGAAFIPSMLSVASWVGAVLLANMFNLRALRKEDAGAPRLSKALGKFVLPAAVVIVQSLVLALVMRRALGIEPVDPVGFYLSAATGSLTFFAVVFALLRLVGDAGKLVAVLLLTLQLTAGGGILPAELTSGFYQDVHAWLPFTYAIEAFRASVFGAYGGNWQQPLGTVALFMAGALVCATVLGRWKLVETQDYRPSIDI